MPSNKQRRQAAQRHLQRQLERRAALARRRRRNLLIVATVAAVALVAGAVWLIGGIGGDDDPSPAAADTSSSTPVAADPLPPTPNPDGTVACDFAADGTGTGVSPPADAQATPAQGTTTLLMSTGQGDLRLTLDRAKAPCAAASFASLAAQQFFDGSPCHRMVNQPTFGVLQCGDPTGTGTGGPGYRFYEEVPEGTTYPRGTIAMANSGTPGSTGSQFFLCFVDTTLPPDYTPVGTVDEAGLAVLDEIAAAGNDGSFEPSPGGGAPNVPVTITTMTVAA